MFWKHSIGWAFIRISAIVALIFFLGVCANAQQVKVGAAAPDFKAADSNGKSESLDQYRGKYVVLEWHN